MKTNCSWTPSSLLPEKDINSQYVFLILGMSQMPAFMVVYSSRYSSWQMVARYSETFTLHYLGEKTLFAMSASIHCD